MSNPWSQTEYLATLLRNPPDALIPIFVHDLRNRTTGIVASAQILTDETITDLTSENKIRMLQDIERSVTDILNILAAISEYDRIQRETSDSSHISS